VRRPRIGITVDVDDERLKVGRGYAALVAAAGGDPLLLAPELAALPGYLELCDGFLLSGGDDPRTETWGEPTHPQATPLDPQRQAFEVALLEALEPRPEVPALGVCLGMQLMGLVAGGRLDQHLPDTLPTADRHWGRIEHEVTGSLGDGVVLSHHRQAIVDPGGLRVAARAPDGVIEAIVAADRRHYVGVQWHPERTGDATLGAGLIARLVDAARR
jgi:putative glutamine amidotransferase